MKYNRVIHQLCFTDGNWSGGITPESQLPPSEGKPNFMTEDRLSLFYKSIVQIPFWFFSELRNSNQQIDSDNESDKTLFPHRREAGSSVFLSDSSHLRCSQLRAAVAILTF